MALKALLNHQEAAIYLNVSVVALDRWAENGRLLPVRFNRQSDDRRYTIEQLDAFGEQLDDWRSSHIQPRDCYRFIDLFAGIGGLRLGFDSTDAQCVFSSEIDRFACRTYSANFGEWPDGDITRTDVTEIPSHDILVGGFPCQPFSIAGVSKYGSLGREHGFRDATKGTLFFDVVRILEYHRPRAFLLENVKNLRTHDRGHTWEVIYRTLTEELEYTVSFRIIDARVLVPQHRERIFIVGFREPVDFEFPEIADEQPQLRSILEADVDPKYTLSDHLWSYLQDYAQKHRQAGNGFGFGLADLNGITRTLSARYYKDGSEILIPQSPEQNPRRLTPRECARLMGFPEWFQIPVSDTQAYKQFGNAVVAPVAERIAHQIVKTLNASRMREQLPVNAYAAADD